MRFTKDHRGNLVMTDQRPALSDKPRRKTQEVAIWPDGIEVPVKYIRSERLYRCAGHAACKLSDLKADLRNAVPDIRFERRA